MRFQRSLRAVLVGTAFFFSHTLGALDSPRPTLVVDHGLPVVAWVEREGGVLAGRVARWDGAKWTRLGERLNTAPDLTVASVSLTVTPGGELWAAWGEKPPSLTGKSFGAGKLRVARWEEGAWKHAPSPSRSDNTVSDRPILKADRRGRPWVNWSEITPDFNVDNVYLAYLQDGRWRLVDDGSLTTDVSSAGRSRDLALAGETPVLVYNKLIYKKDFQVFAGPWNGRWAPWGGTLNTRDGDWAGFPSLVLTPDPVVAFVQAGDAFRLVVKRWRGGSWEALGTPGGAGARQPRLTSVAGRPWMAWLEPGGLFTARWKDGWEPLPGTLATPGAFVDSADLAGGGAVWLVWAEDDREGQRLGLARWDEAAGTWGVVSRVDLPR